AFRRSGGGGLHQGRIFSYHGHWISPRFGDPVASTAGGSKFFVPFACSFQRLVSPPVMFLSPFPSGSLRGPQRLSLCPLQPIPNPFSQLFPRDGVLDGFLGCLPAPEHALLQFIPRSASRRRPSRVPVAAPAPRSPCPDRSRRRCISCPSVSRRCRLYHCRRRGRRRGSQEDKGAK